MPVGIITGAASGIGAACAKMLKEKSTDWKLVLGDVNVKAGEAVAASLGKDVIFEKCDASNYDDIANLFAIAKEKFGRVDFVAANAGVAETINIAKPLELSGSEVPPKPPLKTIDVNLYGPIYAAYLAIHYFRTNSPQTGGRYVVTSSCAGLYGQADLPLYCSSKFGAVGLVRSLGQDKELTKMGVTFNAICPGWVETGLAPPGMIEFVREKIPQIITPMSTIMKAYNMFLDSDMTAQAVECTGHLAEPRPEPTDIDGRREALNSLADGAFKSSDDFDMSKVGKGK